MNIFYKLNNVTSPVTSTASLLHTSNRGTLSRGDFLDLQPSKAYHVENIFNTVRFAEKTCSKSERILSKFRFLLMESMTVFCLLSF